MQEILRVVKVSTILVDERARKDLGDIEELKTSIKEGGVIQPIALEELNGEYHLLAGERRLRAVQALSLEEIPAKIFIDLTPFHRKRIELEENILRKDMQWQEEVTLKNTLQRLYTEEYGEKIKGNLVTPSTGHSMRDTAARIGCSPSSLSKDLIIARAIEVLPQLRDCESKSEALKMLNKMAGNLFTKDRAQEVLSSRESKPDSAIRQELDNVFIIADFLESSRDIPDSSIDIIELDPPYSINLKEQRKADASVTLEYIEIPAEDYIEFMTKVFNTCYRVLKHTGWIICWFGPDPWFDTILRLMREAGFKVCGIPGAWIKPAGQTNNPMVRLANSYELFFYGYKGVAELTKKGQSNTFSFGKVSPTKKIHPDERPIELIEEILSTFGKPGDSVLVPFLGSGNTIKAAYNNLMKAFGYELSQEYKDRYLVSIGNIGEDLTEYKFRSYNE